ncbi:MAG TPA: putative Ig domain-containing protein [Bryobacteraceae bacterium]|nr:putative Ig domain-containing protein [Bryobacteraceae bacterium]
MLKAARLYSYALTLAATLGSAFVLSTPASAQTCSACAAVSIPPTPVHAVVSPNSNPQITDASTGWGEFSIKISPSSTGAALPAQLPAGNYQGWCGTVQTDQAGQTPDFTASTSLGSTNPPITSTVLGELIYLLNHKQGTVADVQEAVWTILTPSRDAYLLANGFTTADAMYQAAVLNFASYTLPAGGIYPVVLLSNNNGVQNMLVETIYGGSIGDRVWLDTATPQTGYAGAGGIQQFNTFPNPPSPYQPGINGVTVKLLDASGNLLATTVTGPSPVNYPYLPPQTNGWYQFTGLGNSTNYQVAIDTTQPALAGTAPSPALQGGNTATDSNANPTTVVLPLGTTNPAVDETNDFGFTGAPPISYSCPSNVGWPYISYSSYVPVTGGSGTFSFSATGLPPGLNLNASTGRISGTPAGADSGTYNVSITATSGGLSQTFSCPINIRPQPLSVSCASGNGQVGVAYSSGISVTGGTGIYSFKLTGGALPDGLILNPATGAITGVPTAAGSFNFTVLVQDSSGSSAYSQVQNCNITIAPALPTLTCPAATATNGSLYTSYLLGNGGTPPYTIQLTSGSLPKNLVLTSTGSTAGLITGQLVQSGTFNFTAQLTDSSSPANTATASCSIAVGANFTVGCPQSVAVAGAAYNSSAVVTGTFGVLAFAVASGALPPGLTLNPATGAITGTPTTPGTYTFTISATDTTAVPAATVTSTGCSITVVAPLTIACAAGTGTQNVPYSSSVAANGGTAPYAYSILSGSLPPGLTLNPATGAITGTPTAAGTFNFTVRVVDSTGGSAQTQTSNCSITIYAPVTANCVTIDAIQGVTITPVTMTASGGTGSGYTFAAAGLPAGLTMSSTGTISGTPTASGTFNYTVTVTDSAGHTGSFNCSVTIAPPIAANCVTISAIQGVAIAPVTMTATGGTGSGYTFSATGLPAGLSMAANGTISGTPTASGTFSYTVTVTDSAGHTGTFNCSVTIAPPIAANCVTISAIQGVAIAPVTMTATGGTGSGYTFAATGLPAGLTMSSSGTISGTPTASGTFNYTVTVTDSAGHTGTFNCFVTVASPPPVTANCAGITAIEGMAITPVSITASGGIGGPYTFTATGLPAGLSISSTGTISGTPVVSGTFNYTVTIKDSAGNTGAIHCSVTVAAPPAITANCAAISATQGVSIAPVTMSASGGVGGPYTFSASGLPAGLTMSSSGTISGTPTLSGTFSYTVTIKDAAGNTGTIHCSVTVAAAPPIAAGDTATIGFWHNQNGQALINCLNGGPNATELGNWLATEFPYLYGPNAGSGNNLAGKTNAQVAAYYMSVFGSDKTGAQIMAGALAAYVTNTGLAGGTGAAGYGFNTSAIGTGGHAYNVGTSGSSIGLSNNQAYTVLTLLQQVNLSKRNGTYSSESGTFNTLFSNINQTGDI